MSLQDTLDRTNDVLSTTRVRLAQVRYSLIGEEPESPDGPTAVANPCVMTSAMVAEQTAQDIINLANHIEQIVNDRRQVQELDQPTRAGRVMHHADELR